MKKQILIKNCPEKFIIAIRNNRNKLLIIFLILIVLLSLFAVLLNSILINTSKIDFQSLEKYKEVVELPLVIDDNPIIDKDIIIVADINNMTLEYNQKETTFVITDKTTGKKWGNFFDETKYEGDLMPFQKKALKSLLTIYYTDFKSFNGNFNNLHSSVETKMQLIKNGVKLNFTFTEIEISLDLYVWLNEYGLVAKIPDASIKEGKNGIQSIELLSFMGSSKLTDKGYYIYPDGCGSLFDLDNQNQSNKTLLSNPVYGLTDLDFEKIDENKNVGVKNIVSPYFGAVINGTGFMGYITEGGEESNINLSTYGFGFNVSKIYSQQIYRKSFVYKNADKEDIIISDKYRNSHDYSVQYLFNATTPTYSSLANSLRNYMVSNKLLNQTKITSDISLDVLMGSVIDNGFTRNYVPVTTFSQLNKINNEIKSKNLRINYNILGWQKNGMYINPDIGLNEVKIGTKDEISKFISTVQKNNDLIYFNHNLLTAQKGEKGFNNSIDVVCDKNNNPVSDFLKENFFLNLCRSGEKFIKETSSEFSKYDINSITLDNVGKYLYSDNNDKNSTTKQDMILQLRKTIDKTSVNIERYTFEVGNSYVFPYASFLQNIPQTDSSYSIMTKSVPFLQMLLHGNIQYTLETPGNMSDDLNELKLKWAEYGAIPYFIITNDTIKKFDKIPLVDIYSSTFSEWKNDIFTLGTEFKNKLGETLNANILSHEYSDNVAKVTYSNNVVVYVNYNINPKDVDGYVVPAKSFISVKKGV